MAQAFLARRDAPEQYRSRTRARLALIGYRQGRKDEAEGAWSAMAEQASDPEALAAAVLGCAEAGAPCGKVLARAAQAAETGEARRTRALNFALGRYQLGKNDYPRAIAYMEAGRDKSNKNKIEANDPEMLAGLAEAYYRTKKFSEGLEIFFEMSQEFAVVRQIQEALQGVYSMEQRAAGDVRIL
jgi:tetratricopeptide (TPR) repeat protein